MGAAENKIKSQRNAADLIRRGYVLGKRQNKPYPNSGGNTMVFASGSAKYQRMMRGKLNMN